MRCNTGAQARAGGRICLLVKPLYTYTYISKVYTSPISNPEMLIEHTQSFRTHVTVSQSAANPANQCSSELRSSFLDVPYHLPFLGNLLGLFRSMWAVCRDAPVLHFHEEVPDDTMDAKAGHIIEFRHPWDPDFSSTFPPRQHHPSLHRPSISYTLLPYTPYEH